MKITIIVPCYNAGKTIETTIKSILVQTHKDFELILVDDGSVDDTRTICEKYAASDDRIKVIPCVHMGVGAARNVAIDIATGSNLCFVDSDDTVESNYLEQLAKHADVDTVVCGYMVDRYDAKGNLLSTEEHLHPAFSITDIEERVKLENAFASGIMHINCNKLYRMDIIRKYNLRYNIYPVNEDFIFILNYLMHSQSITFVPKALYHWIRIDGILSSVESIPQNIIQIYEHSHNLLAQFFRNDEIADRISYRSYELIIYKYLKLYRAGNISSSECYQALSKIQNNKMVKRAFAAYRPSAPFEKVLYMLNRLGWFRITNLILKIIVG